MGLSNVLDARCKRSFLKEREEAALDVPAANENGALHTLLLEEVSHDQGVEESTLIFVTSSQSASCHV